MEAHPVAEVSSPLPVESHERKEEAIQEPVVETREPEEAVEHSLPKEES